MKGYELIPGIGFFHIKVPAQNVREFPSVKGILPGRTVQPEEEYLKREQVRGVAAQMEQLPEVQQRALYLYAVEDKSYQEIALMLQKSVPQIKIAFHRARKKQIYQRE